VTRLLNTEIESHELLTSEQHLLCKAMRNESRRAGHDFTLYDFAKVALRATARDYVEASDLSEAAREQARVTHERALQRAAILFVYEALKACDINLIKQWPEFDEMLRSIVMLAGDLP